MEQKLCRTAGELVAELQKFPAETKLHIIGADIGGYDVSGHQFGYVFQNADGSVTIDHGEHEAWQDLRLKKITREQFDALYRAKE